jgi:hypothetical protein
MTKIYFTLIGIIFIGFSIVQYNDPDPYMWIIMYSLVSILQFYRIWKRPNSWFILFLTGFYVGMSFAWSFRINEWSIMIEDVNETFGLLLAGIFIGLTVFPLDRTRKSTKS